MPPPGSAGPSDPTYAGMKVMVLPRAKKRGATPPADPPPPPADPAPLLPGLSPTPVAPPAEVAAAADAASGAADAEQTDPQAPPWQPEMYYAPGQVIAGSFTLDRLLGCGGKAAVYAAVVDLEHFDYRVLYAYQLVMGVPHIQRRQAAEAFLARLGDAPMEAATMRALMLAHQMYVPESSRLAVKLARPGSSAADLARFENEWRSLLCLGHPHVVQVYGGGESEGECFFIMELLPDVLTRTYVRQQLPLRDKLMIVLQAGLGVQFLHEQGLIHRDIKPQNLLTYRLADGAFHTKVADLGLAKNTGPDQVVDTSDADLLVGTPLYSAPEQIRTPEEVDGRCDVYSLGAVLYEFASGKTPYHDTPSLMALITTIANGQPPLPPETHCPGIPEVLAAIIAHAMAPAPADRYARASDLVADLDQYLAHEHPDLLTPPTFAPAARAQSTARAAGVTYRCQALHHLHQHQGAPAPDAGDDLAPEPQDTWGGEPTMQEAFAANLAGQVLPVNLPPLKPKRPAADPPRPRWQALSAMITAQPPRPRPEDLSDDDARG